MLGNHEKNIYFTFILCSCDGMINQNFVYKLTFPVVKLKLKKYIVKNKITKTIFKLCEKIKSHKLSFYRIQNKNIVGGMEI